MSHLEEKQHDHETGTNNYYEKVDNAAFERSKMALQALLEEGLDNEILSKANMKQCTLEVRKVLTCTQTLIFTSNTNMENNHLYDQL